MVQILILSPDVLGKKKFYIVFRSKRVCWKWFKLSLNVDKNGRVRLESFFHFEVLST